VCRLVGAAVADGRVARAHFTPAKAWPLSLDPLLLLPARARSAEHRGEEGVLCGALGRECGRDPGATAAVPALGPQFESWSDRSFAHATPALVVAKL
jgi:hypothetical protein